MLEESKLLGRCPLRVPQPLLELAHEGIEVVHVPVLLVPLRAVGEERGAPRVVELRRLESGGGGAMAFFGVNHVRDLLQELLQVLGAIDQVPLGVDEVFSSISQQGRLGRLALNKLSNGSLGLVHVLGEGRELVVHLPRRGGVDTRAATPAA